MFQYILLSHKKTLRHNQKITNTLTSIYKPIFHLLVTATYFDVPNSKLFNVFFKFTWLYFIKATLI